MSGLWIFAYVVLPAIVVALGYAAVRSSDHRDHHLKPGA